MGTSEQKARFFLHKFVYTKKKCYNRLMKKILCSLLILLSFGLKAEAKDYFAQGVTDYKAGKYSEAMQNFEFAVKLNPQNVNARYYLAQTYLLQKYTCDAQKQYNRIILLAPQSEAARLSQKGLSLIRQAELGNGEVVATSSGYGDNYLPYVLKDGKITKWEKFPISVYIEPKAAKNIAQKAFSKWQSATKGVVKFAFSTNPNSQIIVKFKDKLESKNDESSYVAGYSKPYYKNGFIAKSEITILTIDPTDKTPLPDDLILFSTLHEIGHSLGCNGHSNDEKDVMYESSTDPKLELTKRDINTMKLLYTLDERTLLDAIKGKTNVKEEQLIAYIKKFPNKAVGYGNLGDYYSGKGNYSKAIQNYQKAIAIEPASGEYYNLIGTTYGKMGENQKAYTNLKRACDLDKNNEFFIMQFAKYCTTPEQKSECNKYIKAFIKANPDKAQSLNLNNL